MQTVEQLEQTRERLELAHERYSRGMDRIVGELRVAFEQSGLTLAELLRLSGLSLHVTTLRRKLIGDGRKKRSKKLVTMSPAEAKALRAVLKTAGRKAA